MSSEQAAPERRIGPRRAPGRRMLDGSAHERRGGAGPGIDIGADNGAGAGAAHDAAARTLLLQALMALRAGDFNVRLPCDWPGMDGKIADAVNDIVATHCKLASAVERVSVAVGIEGRLSQRMQLDRANGAWGEEVNAINSMIDNLVQPVREVGRAIGAVAHGDLSRKIGTDARGEVLTRWRGAATRAS